jgi:hypothetical protein
MEDALALAGAIVQVWKARSSGHDLLPDAVLGPTWRS